MRIIRTRLQQNWRVQSVQWRVEGVDQCQHPSPAGCYYTKGFVKPCISKHMTSRGKPATTRMVIVKLFWKDGTRMTNTESLCQILDALQNRLKQYDTTALEDHSYVSTIEERCRIKNSCSISLNRGHSRTNESTSWFHWCEAQMQETVWRTHSENWWRKHTDSSCTANETATWPTTRGPRWVQLHSWSSNRMDSLPFNQTNNYVFVSALEAARRLEVE